MCSQLGLWSCVQVGVLPARVRCCCACCAAGQTLAASYPAAIQSLPPAAEELRSRLGGLGGAGEVGLQSLAKVAAGVLAAVLSDRPVGHKLFSSSSLVMAPHWPC